MKIITLDTVMEEVGSQSRLHFAGLMEKRPQILEKLETEGITMRELIASSWRELTKEPYQVVENSYNFVFRKGSSDFCWLQVYDSVHFRNSLLINMVLKEQEESASKLNKVIYLLYAHNFMRKEMLIDDLTQSVCFELQELIRLLIEKETTVYRDYSTAQAIEALRWRLTSERVTLLARGPASINFRRNI